MSPPLHPVSSQLETLSDSEGSVTIGWVGQHVLYARLTGGLTANLGADYAARFEKLVTSVPSLKFFSDGRAVTHYDLLARSTFFRAVLSNRHRFASLTFLNWSSELGTTARSFMELVGGLVNVLTNPSAFEQALLQAAPGCVQKPIEASSAPEK